MSKHCTCVHHIKFKSTPAKVYNKRQMIKKHHTNESQPKVKEGNIGSKKNDMHNHK